MALTQVAAIAVVVLGSVIGVNIAQNGSEQRVAPKLYSKEDVLKLSCKADFVAAWRAGAAPADYHGRKFDARVLPLGVLAPVSSFITHRLFGGIGGGEWLGKAFMKEGVGINRFTGGDKVSFGARVAPSNIDKRPALVLDYSAGDSRVWGSFLGMRDEIREVAPGVLLGLGSMTASGGMQNSAPFMMWKAPR